eukprot:scaffold5868_cov120-Isochrysis_galbana.AAC.1
MCRLSGKLEDAGAESTRFFARPGVASARRTGLGSATTARDGSASDIVCSARDSTECGSDVSPLAGSVTARASGHPIFNAACLGGKLKEAACGGDSSASAAFAAGAGSATDGVK